MIDKFSPIKVLLLHTFKKCSALSSHTIAVVSCHNELVYKFFPQNIPYFYLKLRTTSHDPPYFSSCLRITSIFLFIQGLKDVTFDTHIVPRNQKNKICTTSLIPHYFIILLELPLQVDNILFIFDVVRNPYHYHLCFSCCFVVYLIFTLDMESEKYTWHYVYYYYTSYISIIHSFTTVHCVNDKPS